MFSGHNHRFRCRPILLRSLLYIPAFLLKAVLGIISYIAVSMDVDFPVPAMFELKIVT
jgi:hypothetical protein